MTNRDKVLGAFLSGANLPQCVVDCELTEVQFDERRNVLTLHILSQTPVGFADLTDSENAIKAYLELADTRIVAKTPKIESVAPVVTVSPVADAPPVTTIAPVDDAPPFDIEPPPVPPPPSRPAENVVVITAPPPAPKPVAAKPPKSDAPPRDFAVGDVLLGKRITEKPTAMEYLASASGSEVVVQGEVFAKDTRTLKGGKTVTVMSLTDKTSSVTMKFFTSSKPKIDAEASIKKGMSLLVHGKYLRDEFEKDCVLEPLSIVRVETVERQDDYTEGKRVELHLHTKMSDMDATNTAEEYIQLAYKWGHRAVAVTDHGNVQAFPAMMDTYEKIMKANPDADFKVIYGMEAYFVNDGKPLITEGARFPLYGDDAEFVVFDVETTGLTPADCKITEIGAVKIRDMQVVEEFSTFINIGEPLPAKIIEITGITDDMLRDAPEESEALSKFLAFCGNCRCLIAHNADFDMGFLRSVMSRCNIECAFAAVDTLALSRAAAPELKSHKLNLMVEHYKLGEFKHHRALNDAQVTAKLFTRIIDDAKKNKVGGLETVGDLNSVFGGIDVKKDKYRHMTILVKSKAGLKNLYKLISYANLDYFYGKPRIPLSELSRHREGLLLGSACEAGELFQAVIAGKPQAELEQIAELYDFLEIMPLGVNAFLIRNGDVPNELKLQLYNKKIYELGKRLGKLVVATGDVHFMNKDDAIFREILQAGQGFKDAGNQAPLYFRTTAEMLAEFDYLGEDIAREVVIDNPNLIADMVESDAIRPIPKGEYRPFIQGAEEELERLCRTKAADLYGEPLHETIQARVDKELGAIIKHGYSVLYVISQKLVKKSENDGYLVGSRGSVGSSVAAYLSGISEVNPLPPHYRCPDCKYTEFDNSVGSGFDLPEKQCPKCGADFMRDGHDIPFETFLGFEGDKVPDIDLNFSGEYQANAHKYTEELFGKEYVFKAGTIAGLQDKNAYGFVRKFLDERGLTLGKAETNRLVAGCVGVKNTTGQHPGGMIVVPTTHEVYDFTPVQRPAGKTDSDIVTTHFSFKALHDTIVKLDILGHDVPTLYKYLEDMTGVKIADVPNADKSVMELFTTPKPLGIDDPLFTTGTYGLPEFGTGFTIQMLKEAQPKTFADLLQVSGLSHGTDVWLGNARDLIAAGTCTISNVIGTRDNIMVYLIKKGMEPTLAFKITEITRKGGAAKFFDDEIYAAFKAHDVPDWYVDSCKKIKYMFPKAHAAAYVMGAVKLGWFKVYRPKEFYAAALMRHTENIDVTAATAGKDAVRKRLESIAAIPDKEKTPKERGTYDALLMVYEMQLRGFRMLAPYYKSSHPTRYIIEDDALRLPYSAIEGCGENAARRIHEVIQGGDFICIEDIQSKSSLNKTVLEKLTNTGFFGDLPVSAQMSLFDL
ncbi:MAG: PolC-type DNA polymerase III [Oscillospiraceae bacterium]|nr:PolC-type DNA polymerase III [Oscillospiraceae bacterium]